MVRVDRVAGRGGPVAGREAGEGVTRRVPHGEAAAGVRQLETTLRLHKGTAVQGLAIYFPEDKAIPVKALPAEPTFTRTFTRDKKLLQREQKPDVPGALALLAYLTVLLIGVTLYASMGWGLALLQRKLGARATASV